MKKVSIAVAVLVTLTGCNKGGDSATGSASSGITVSDADMAEAKTIYEQRCVACHGATGKGDGPGAAALDPKPRNFAEAAWQKSATNEAIAKSIVEGGAAVGKSPLMPPNPDLSAKKGVVDGLTKMIRGYGG
jgi:mono/diheme cytochrome c family protein